MRDKKDNATFDLPGFEPAASLDRTPASVLEPTPSRPRPRSKALKQEQLCLIDETDTTGLPVWRRDHNLDLTGLPVWAPDPE